MLCGDWFLEYSFLCESACPESMPQLTCSLPTLSLHLLLSRLTPWGKNTEFCLHHHPLPFSCRLAPRRDWLICKCMSSSQSSWCSSAFVAKAAPLSPRGAPFGQQRRTVTLLVLQALDPGPLTQCPPSHLLSLLHTASSNSDLPSRFLFFEWEKNSNPHQCFVQGL